jgi:hypothetical protein
MKLAPNRRLSLPNESSVFEAKKRASNQPFSHGRESFVSEAKKLAPDRPSLPRSEASKS